MASYRGHCSQEATVMQDATAMKERTRFRESLLFGRPDKVPLWPGEPRESTLKVWHRQGLTQGADWFDRLTQILGIPHGVTNLRLDLGRFFKMIPTFEEKVLEHRGGHYIVQDWMGAITEISDQYDYTYIRSSRDFVTRKWHRFPVENHRDWDGSMQWRYDVHHPERFPEDFEERCHALRDREHVLEIVINGPFWQLREWCGFENLCMLMVDEPRFVQEMIDFWTEFVLRTLESVQRNVELDLVWVSEDMAYKMHSMISPAMARRFLLPTWTKWAQAIKAGGCPVVCMDCDGHVGDLIPLWIEAGINCCYPCEVAAGNDIVALRREYGKDMAYIGGLDKRALARGGRELEAEVLRVVPPLLEQGGFIAGCDHGVPPDIPWSNFVEYSRLIAELTGWR